MHTNPLGGVYAAAVTPLTAAGKPDLDAIPGLMDFYARRGCHGALLLGTTGEGPSFSPAERRAVLEAAAAIRGERPEFRLLAGTGTPSLDETSRLNKTAFDLGCDAVVVLPPYYFRAAGEDGLYAWFREVIQASVPEDGLLLAYHFPAMSGVDLPLSLLLRLQDEFPTRFGGLKDSSGDLEHAVALAEQLENRLVLVGSDRLLSKALQSGASGCITAAANLISPQLRLIWDAFQAGQNTDASQGYVDQAREIISRYKPFPAAIKGLLAELHGFPLWPVRPPLLPFPPEDIAQAAGDLQALPAA